MEMFSGIIYLLINIITFSSVRSPPQSQLNKVLGSPVKLEESSCPQQVLNNIFVPMETIKSSMFLKPQLIWRNGCFLLLIIYSHPSLCDVFTALWILSKCLSFSCLFIGNLEPITLFDQGGIHVSLHFAKDSPLGHPGVAVVVISTVNTSALDVKDFLFQAAVPKVINSKETVIKVTVIKCR